MCKWKRVRSSWRTTVGDTDWSQNHIKIISYILWANLSCTFSSMWFKWNILCVLCPSNATFFSSRCSHNDSTTWFNNVCPIYLYNTHIKKKNPSLLYVNVLDDGSFKNKTKVTSQFYSLFQYLQFLLDDGRYNNCSDSFHGIWLPNISD